MNYLSDTLRARVDCLLCSVQQVRLVKILRFHLSASIKIEAPPADFDPSEACDLSI